MTASATLAIIIGSGFDALAGDAARHDFITRFGVPSATIRETVFEGLPVLTLARHGDDHTIPPHAINYRANLVALGDLGATTVVALNTVGAVSELCSPGDIAIPDQLLDYTWGREHTVYDGRDDAVEHIDFTEPFAAGVRAALIAAAETAGIQCRDGGVYAATQGPRLETAAEVDRLARDGADYVGMTAMPEAAIARELGLDYACIAMVVNRAAGRSDQPIHEEVAASTAAAAKLTMRLLRQFATQAK